MPTTEPPASVPVERPRRRVSRTAHCAPLLFALVLVAGCGVDPVLDCEPASGIEVDCQFQNPEDLALAPDGRLLVSQFGGLTDARPGNLAIYDPHSRELKVLFPPSNSVSSGESIAQWGEGDCPFPDTKAFAPHGIDIELRNDGRRALAAINHGGRESVELFEVFDNGDLAWRGCVLAPEEGFFNDVVLLRDGGFWVTHMFPKSSGIWSVIKSSVGIDTGWVYAWTPGAGFSKVPGSDAPFPNGIEKSADERHLYLNTSSAAGIRKINATTGALLATRELAPLDNSTWSEDGRLLVASLLGTPADQIACQTLEQGTCGMSFEILAVDPEDLTTEVLIANEGPPMGGVTVALQRNGVFYLGTFAGDRLGIVAP